jgi:uncharacterized spore protein YtfJ
VDPQTGFKSLRRALSARTVYGEAVEREGVTVIPAATVIGGGGLGANEATPDGRQAAAGGGGFGLVAWPSGAIEIRGDQVRWRRTFDSTYFLVTALWVALATIKAIRAARS